MSEERTAYHEAGHAVVSWVEGLEMEGASMEKQGSSSGRVSFADIEAMEVYPEILERRLLSCYAGVKAVELYTGRPTDFDDPNIDPRVKGSDWDECMDLILRLAGSDELAQVALQERVEEEAQRILGENWRGVQAVAQALLRNRSLDSTDLSRILEEASCPRGEPVYDYELNKLADRKEALIHRYNALLQDGRHEEARRIRENLARVESEMDDLSRLAEGYDEQLHHAFWLGDKMPRYFTHYWRNETWEDHRDLRQRGLLEDPLRHVADNKFVDRGVKPGDYIYPVTVMDGTLYLLGKLQVGKVCDFEEAASTLGTTDLWEARDHIIASEPTPTHFDLAVPLELTKRLTFISGDRTVRLTFKSRRRLDQQTLRGVRELDSTSAAELDRLLTSIRSMTYPPVNT